MGALICYSDPSIRMDESTSGFYGYPEFSNASGTAIAKLINNTDRKVEAFCVLLYGGATEMGKIYTIEPKKEYVVLDTHTFRQTSCFAYQVMLRSIKFDGEIDSVWKSDSKDGLSCNQPVVIDYKASS